MRADSLLGVLTVRVLNSRAIVSQWAHMIFAEFIKDYPEETDSLGSYAFSGLIKD